MKIHLLPAFKDNYFFVVADENTNKCWAIDPGSAEILDPFLKQYELQLETILVTHQHRDHIGGVRVLADQWKCEVLAPQRHRTEFDFSSQPLVGGETLECFGSLVRVISTPGHTAGHLSYSFPEQKWLFSGDVIFGLGCGRIFPDGDLMKQYVSLQTIKSLPDDTQIFCGHDYTELNYQFCVKYLKLELANYSLKKPFVPLILGNERLCNPFLTVTSYQDFCDLRTTRNVWQPEISIP